MTYKQAVREFQDTHRKLYIDRVDYWTAFECWDAYTDMLCKNGEITERQCSTWSTPFPYGKHLEPSKEQLEMALKFSH